MDREEAIQFLKGMIPTHSSDTVNSVVIVPPNKVSNTLSVGYQIHITGSSAHHAIQDLEARVKRDGLALREENGIVIIYKPRTH